MSTSVVSSQAAAAAHLASAMFAGAVTCIQGTPQRVWCAMW
jgi:hypothetical protein